MLDWSRDAATYAVGMVRGWFHSARIALNDWIHGGDTTFMVVMVGVALIMLIIIVTPRRSR